LKPGTLIWSSLLQVVFSPLIVFRFHHHVCEYLRSADLLECSKGILHAETPRSEA